MREENRKKPLGWATVEEGWLTRRERIVEVLRRAERPLSVREIAERLGLDVSPRELYDDIAHAARSLWRRSGGRERIVVVLPKCRNCGFEFRDLNRLRKPSRCPRCKSERIDPPKFFIEED